LRSFPSARVKQLGFDEHYYEVYLKQYLATGLEGYPKIARTYIESQSATPNAVIPPTRFLYLSAAYLVQRISNCDPLDALHYGACIFASLSLVATAMFAARMGGLR